MTDPRIDEITAIADDLWHHRVTLDDAKARVTELMALQPARGDEAVAWEFRNVGTKVWTDSEKAADVYRNAGATVTPLYAAPPEAALSREGVMKLASMSALLRRMASFMAGATYTDGRRRPYSLAMAQEARALIGATPTEALFPNGGDWMDTPGDVRVGDGVSGEPAKPEACPACGGSLTTWKCDCKPIWPGYAATECTCPPGAGCTRRCDRNTEPQA